MNRKKSELDHHIRSCRHDYTKTKYDPIVTPGHYFPGDPEGTMGIDRQLPMHIPEERKDRWSRECNKCGEVEYTTRVNEEIIKTPKW